MEQAESVPITSRRGFLGHIVGAYCAIGAIAGASAVEARDQPDAELLRLWDVFDAHLRLLREEKEQNKPAHSAYDDLVDAVIRNDKSGAPPYEEFFRHPVAVARNAAVNREGGIFDALDDLSNRMREMKAEGFPGLLVKARLVLYDTTGTCLLEGATKSPDPDEDWEVTCARAFLAECERLALLEQKGGARG
ncbi:hypothetical protein V5F72_24110 [Xanthobacter flavus]|uniref:hypothetical protein n=1 Tax=Xanthobacter flavus TaxID=281 RepID=UPI00372A048F